MKNSVEKNNYYYTMAVTLDRLGGFSIPVKIEKILKF